jgi:hypothetical protein
VKATGATAERSDAAEDHLLVWPVCTCETEGPHEDGARHFEHHEHKTTGEGASVAQVLS